MAEHLILNEPVYCRPEAFQYFVEQLPGLRHSRGLLRAAIAVSMHAVDDVVPARVGPQIHDVASAVRGAADGPEPTSIRIALHQLLFDEMGYSGDSDKYYHALNSYIGAVINSRRGLPITLSLLYKMVGEGAGLQVAGINAPGHFLVRVR